MILLASSCALNSFLASGDSHQMFSLVERSCYVSELSSVRRGDESTDSLLSLGGGATEV